MDRASNHCSIDETISKIETPRKSFAFEMCWYMRTNSFAIRTAGMAHSIEIRVPLVDAATNVVSLGVHFRKAVVSTSQVPSARGFRTSQDWLFYPYKAMDIRGSSRIRRKRFKRVGKFVHNWFNRNQHAMVSLKDVGR
jgi:hypothetical protein